MHLHNLPHPPYLLHAEKSKATPCPIHGVPCYILPLYRVTAVIYHTSAESCTTYFWSHIYTSYNFSLITFRTYIILSDAVGLLINWMALYQQKRLYSMREKRERESVRTCKKKIIAYFMTPYFKVRKVKQQALTDIPYLRNRNSFYYSMLWTHTTISCDNSRTLSHIKTRYKFRFDLPS